MASDAPPQSALHPHRKRRWIWIILAGALVIVGGLFLFGFALDESLTHDLLDADFEAGPAPFETGHRGRATADLVAGTYRLRAAVGEGPVSSLAYFARTAYSVDLEADLVALSGPAGTNPVAGIGCMSEQGSFYGLLINTGGDVALGRIDSDNTVHSLASGTIPGRDGPWHLKLSCYRQKLLDSKATKLTGWVNGTQVLDATDDEGFNNFDRATLVLLAVPTNTATARFDTVVATVPG